MQVVIVEPEKKPFVQNIDDTLTSMQQIVGGTIQAVYPFDEPVALICNDEGKLLNLPLNRALRDSNGAIYDIVAGTFFLCAAGDHPGNTGNGIYRDDRNPAEGHSPDAGRA